MTVRALMADDVLRLWEVCAAQHPAERALAMLQAAWPGEPRESLAALPLGERERRLVALRVRLFGPHAGGACACPACGELHEVEAPVEEILRAPEAPCGPFAVEAAGHALTVKVPDGADQTAVASCESEAEALSLLVSRCVLAASVEGVPVEPAALPPEVIEALGEVLAERDPNAETLLALTCDRCGHPWTLVFDGGEFLWSELAARARRLVYEVHVLASRYGWREADVIGMSARRRAAYLEHAAR